MFSLIINDARNYKINQETKKSEETFTIANWRIMTNGANENKRYNHFGLNVFKAPEEKRYRQDIDKISKSQFKV